MKPQYRIEPQLTPRAKDTIGSFPKRVTACKITPHEAGLLLLMLNKCSMFRHSPEAISAIEKLKAHVRKGGKK